MLGKKLLTIGCKCSATNGNKKYEKFYVKELKIVNLLFSEKAQEDKDLDWRASEL
jgi:hypothetical protein